MDARSGSGRPRSHFAGFDGLRLVAAVAVMFSHAFLIATSREDGEPFVRLLGPGNIIGLYGVFTFFIISGFLLAQSLSANRSAVSFTVNRVLRLLPAFAFYVAIAVLVIGPLFSSLRAGGYFSSPELSDFVRDSLNTLGDAELPGVFNYHFGNDGLVSVVNGSLWSLRYEAQSYVFLLLVWTFAVSDTVATGVIAAIALLAWTVTPVANAITGISYTLPYFAGGVVMHWVHRRWGTNGWGALACAGAMAAACVFKVPMSAFAIFGAYLVVFVGERPNPGSTLAGVIGDCSYGLYLYGWPAEQMVKQLTGSARPMVVFSLALPVAMGLAWISCHLVEQPALRWKKRATAQIRSIVSLAHGPSRAGILGAKVAFAIGTIVILLSVNRSWSFLESMGQIVIGVVAVSIATVLLTRMFVRPAHH